MSTPPFSRDQQIEFMRTAQERMKARAAVWLADPEIRSRLGATPNAADLAGVDQQSTTTMVEHVTRRRCV